jgi:hypothetical protein
LVIIKECVVPGIDLTGILRTNIVSLLRKSKISIGLCNLLGKEGVIVIDDWVTVAPALGGIPA